MLQLVLEGAEGALDWRYGVWKDCCDDGNDDDQDGLIDCDDESDCWFELTCGGSLCPT